MAINKLDTEAGTNIVMNALRDRVIANLYDTAVESIRPALLQACRDAVAELEPMIQKQYDMYAQNVVFNLIVREPK